MKQSTALITGASSGIGKELSILFAKGGINLIILARRIERLNELKKELEEKYNINVEVIQKDLSEVGAGESVFKEIKQKGIEIDYLVNNAGFGGFGEFVKRDWIKDKNMINVNITALTELTRFFLPGMIERNKGNILNIGSTAGFLPGPLQAVYYATKSYVISFSQAISEEVSNTNVKVTVVCPRATETEFASRGNLDKTKLFKSKTVSAETLAKRAYKAMKKGKLVYVDGKMMAFLLRFIIPFIPRKQVLKMSRSYMEE